MFRCQIIVLWGGQTCCAPTADGHAGPLQNMCFTMFQPLGHQKHHVFPSFQQSPIPPTIDSHSGTLQNMCPMMFQPLHHQKHRVFQSFRSPMPPSIDSLSTVVVWAWPTRIKNNKKIDAVPPHAQAHTQCPGQYNIAKFAKFWQLVCS